MSADPLPSRPVRLLHLEDNAVDAELIRHALHEAWPDCRIERVQTHVDFSAALRREKFDLILSDFSLPAFDGLEALDLARQLRPETPYIFFSGTIGEEKAAEALERGATDYVRKDHPGRLVPAIRRVLETKAIQDREVADPVRGPARGLEGARDDLQPRVIIWDVAQQLGETLPETISVETSVPATLALVRGNPGQLGRVLMNLGVNARQAMPGGGRIRISARNVEVDEKLARAHPGSNPGAHVLIAVSDTGAGIPAPELDRILDPFGAAGAKAGAARPEFAAMVGIVKDDGGFLEAESHAGQGTEFRLYFPASTLGGKTSSNGDQGPPARGRNETILVIDDEETIRIMLKAILNTTGYRAILAADGLEGVAAYRTHGGEIKAVLTDIMMPGMQGAQMVRELRSLNPDVRIVAMSGLLGENCGLDEEAGRLKFLQKPMTGADLARALQSVLPHD